MCFLSCIQTIVITMMTLIILEPVLHSAYYGAFVSPALAVKCIKSSSKLIFYAYSCECIIKRALFFIELCINTLLLFMF